jgi:hypothetical protein
MNDKVNNRRARRGYAVMRAAQEAHGIQYTVTDLVVDLLHHLHIDEGATMEHLDMLMSTAKGHFHNEQ